MNIVNDAGQIADDRTEGLFSCCAATVILVRCHSPILKVDDQSVIIQLCNFTGNLHEFNVIHTISDDNLYVMI